MAGVSVSVAYLDDELDDLWRDPVDSVALSRGRVPEHAFAVTIDTAAVVPPIAEAPPPGSVASQVAAAVVSCGAEAVAAALDAVAVAAAVMAFAVAIRARGGAEVGDKTMIDAVVPFADDLQERVGMGQTLAAAWRSAAEVAARAAADTAALAPRRGRARIHETKSLGTPDAGAVSFGIAVRSSIR